MVSTVVRLPKQNQLDNSIFYSTPVAEETHAHVRTEPRSWWHRVRRDLLSEQSRHWYSHGEPKPCEPHGPTADATHVSYPTSKLPVMQPRKGIQRHLDAHLGQPTTPPRGKSLREHPQHSLRQRRRCAQRPPQNHCSPGQPPHQLGGRQPLPSQHDDANLLQPLLSHNQRPAA